VAWRGRGRAVRGSRGYPPCLADRAEDPPFELHRRGVRSCISRGERCARRTSASGRGVNRCYNLEPDVTPVPTVSSPLVSRLAAAR
jgi:hypothetical protein